jgi:lipoprotein-releasing system ATP-binding protein
MGIVLQNVQKDLGSPPTSILKDINLELRDGEFVALTGKSGSGKSTLLYLLSSLDEPTSGRVLIDDKDPVSMSSRDIHDFRNREMGFVFQFHYLLAELTVLENVLMPARRTHRQAELESHAVGLLEEVGLADKRTRFPNQLSGGEQQRVAIARALVMRPRYLFTDEPTGNLDSVNGEIVMRLLRRINTERRTTVVMVTHDADFARQAPRQIHMVDGRID